jgi:excisionase family DNA binding protein
MEDSRPTLTLTEAARGLGVRTATLRAQIARGRLQADRRGRDWHVKPDEVVRYRSEVQLRRPSRSSALDEVVRAIARGFEETGQWPQTRMVQRTLVQAGFEGDVAEIGNGLDPSLGRIEKSGTARLSVRGLIRADAAEAVADFERAMRLAISRYGDSSIADPQIGSADFAGADWTATRSKRLREVLTSNPFITASGGGSDVEWTYSVSDDIHLLGRARTINGYLTALDRLTTPRGLLDVGPRSADWPTLEARIRELGPLLDKADSLDEVQDIGRRCREIVGDLLDLVAPPASAHGSRESTPGDRKARFDVFLDRRVDGESRGALRRLLRSTLGLANAVTHSSRGARIEAVACAHAAVLLTRTLRELVAE